MSLKKTAVLLHLSCYLEGLEIYNTTYGFCKMGPLHKSNKKFGLNLPFGANAMKKFTPSLGIPYLGVKFENHLSLLSLGS